MQRYSTGGQAPQKSIHLLPAYASILFVDDVAYSDKYRIKSEVNIRHIPSNWMLPCVDLFFEIKNVQQSVKDAWDKWI